MKILHAPREIKKLDPYRNLKLNAYMRVNMRTTKDKIQGVIDIPKNGIKSGGIK
jgi:hypothetical protein